MSSSPALFCLQTKIPGTDDYHIVSCHLSNSCCTKSLISTLKPL
uniref:Uncharacterized protein n=1 Tax=Arundo donax TaxID=35708 RepID=A0A0A8YK80_ARUDO